MKKILLIATIALCFSCKKDTGDAVNGTIDESFNGKKVYISHLEENNATTKIADALPKTSTNTILQTQCQDNLIIISDSKRWSCYYS